MRLVTLGKLELRGSSFTRTKPLLLLTYLSLEGEQNRGYLAELFWPTGTSRQQRNNLSKALSDLRTGVPDSVGSTDVKVWTTLSADVTDFDAAVSVGDYERAAELYGGPFYDGQLSGWGTELEEWLYTQRERLAEAAQEARLGLAEVSDDPYLALEHARAAFRLAEPGVDRLQRFYTLFAENDQSLAKEVLDLARGYGLSLNAELPDGDYLGVAKPLTPQPPNDASPEPPPHLSQPAPYRLPFKGTSFVGREIELGEIAYVLSQPSRRLLSLVGMGGVGKSRLAIQAGHELRGTGPDGIYFVALEALLTPELIPHTVATTLNLVLTGPDAPLAQLSRAIGTQTILLILDNFEHLLDGATLVSELLQACPNLTILVTSRERLGLEEEWVLPVEGLSLPKLSETDQNTHDNQNAPYVDAVQLFVQRAMQAKLTFALTPDTLPDVLELCHLLAGSPLALELAAAWTRLLSVAELKREIERDLDTLNTRVKRTDRHESLRTVFDYSWKLLSPQEQTLLKQLSVFRGGFSREAVAKVTGASVVALAALVDKSLLRVQAAGRFEWHPLVFQYVQEKLEAEPDKLVEAQEKHLMYFLELAKGAQPHLIGREQKVWFERFEQDHDNFRAALTYADLVRATELAGYLVAFWDTRSYWHEGRAWLEQILAHSSSDTSSSFAKARAHALSGASRFARHQGDYEAASRYISEAVAISKHLKDKQETARSLNELGGIHYYLGHLDKATECAKEVVVLNRELGDKRGVSAALSNLSMLAHKRGRLSEAYDLQQQSIQLAKELGNKLRLCVSLNNLGNIALALDDVVSAQEAYQNSLAIAQEIDSPDNIARCLNSLGDLAASAGRFDEAHSYWSRSLLIYQKLGSHRALHVLGYFVSLAAEQEQWLRCACLAAATGAFLKGKETDSHILETQEELGQVRARAKSQLNQEDFSRAVATGSQMNLDEAVRYATQSFQDVTAARD